MKRDTTKHANRSTVGQWHSRGYLPHADFPGEIQFVTFRLFDSLPQAILRQINLMLKAGTNPGSSAQMMRKFHKALDSGIGRCYLRAPRVAMEVQRAVLFQHGRRCKLHAWTVMPNHVHLLIEPFEEISLSEIIHSIKSFSASAGNRALSRSGSFWYREYYDRYIRNENHYAAVLNYIQRNPVLAGLCSTPEEWEHSSASYSYRENRWVKICQVDSIEPARKPAIRSAGFLAGPLRCGSGC